MSRFPATALLAFAVVLLSCFGGPPNVPPSGTLGPSGDGLGAHPTAAFAVVFAGPRGTVTDLRQPAVTVLFNRPAHDPNSAETDGLPPIAMQSSDGRATAGSWQWVGTHGLLFTPEQPLAGSTRFAVTVPAGVRSLEGATLATDYRFEFATARPAVERVVPAEGSADVRADGAFRLDFNEPMDPAVVERCVRLTARTRPEDPGKVLALHASHPQVGKHPERTVLLSPAQALPLDSAIDLTLAKGLHGEGPLATSSDRHLSFRTYGPLRLADLVCPRSTGPRCEAHRDVTLVMTNAVDPAEFRAHFFARDLPRHKPDAEHPKTTKIPLPSREQRIDADPDFGKRYRLKVTAGLRDVFGQILDRDLTIDLDTDAPFVGPGQATASRTGAGSNDPPTEPMPPPDDPRPHRPRLDYRLAIGLQGHVLEAPSKDAPGPRVGPHRVRIGAMNIPSYAMMAAKIREDEALAWLDHAAAVDESTGVLARPWTWVNPGSPENVRFVQTVDLDALLGGPGARGAALLALALPGRMTAPDASLLTVTDLGVSARLSRYGGVVWVTRLSTGAPVANAIVSIRKASKPELFATTTDAGGLATIPADRFSAVTDSGQIDGAAIIFVRKDDDWTYQRVERAAASFRSGVDVDLEQRGAWAGMIYTDRGVYRPGEPVKVAGVFRRVDATGIRVEPGEAIRIAATDAEGETIFDGRAQLDAFGAIALDVPLPKTSHLGEARIAASFGRKDTDAFEDHVLLAAYKASEFKVGVDPDKRDYVRGDTARFDVHAEYLFGAPMGGASIRNRVSRSFAPYEPPHSEGFVTSDEANLLDHTETSPRAEELRVDDGSLDEEGRYSASVALDLRRMAGPELVTFESEVEDLSHQTVARTAAVRVHPAAFYLGIERQASRFVAVGAAVRAAVAAFDPTGARVPGAKAHVELVRRTWTGVVEDEAATVPRRRSRVVDDVVGACDITTVATSPTASCAVRVREPGFYIIRAQSKDARGNDVEASTSFYAVDDQSDAPATDLAWGDPDARGLKLETDKKQYRAGEVAKVLVRNPFKVADALVTVERAGVLWSHVVALAGPMPIVEVPISAQYFPNAFIAVHLVRGRVQAAPDAGADVGAPDFRLGIAPIEVDPDTHRLAVKVATDRAEYRPGDQVDADVTVTDRDGRAARGEVSFFVVDEGVLMLTGYKTPDPLPAFTAEQRLAVFSLESRESLARLIPMIDGERIKPLGYEFAESNRDDKGAAGGGGGQTVRADFKTTAYFETGRVTNVEGRAHYRFKLPDNLTTFRLMAVVAGDDRFGAGESTITTNRKLMARPAMPRLIRVGDTFEAGVIVSSRGLATTAVDVALRAKGVALAGPAARRVQVPKGGSVEVRFLVRALAPGMATFEFAVAGAGEKDAVHVERSVELPVDVETASVYGETTTAAAVALGELRDLRRDQGGLEVHLASTALVGLKTSFDRTLEYPYGCTEQLTSRILPLLVMPDMARLCGVRMPAKIEDVVEGALGELFEHQRGSGGFGYWETDDAVPWLSAYAMLAIETAAKKGYFVPKGARDSGIAYLRQVLDHTRIGDSIDESDPSETPPDESDPDGSGSSEEKPARAYATLAFVADVLASLGQVDPGYLNRLFDARVHRALFTQALLLHAMAVAHMPALEVDGLAKELEARVRVDADSAFADEADTLYGDFLDSSSRTTALVLRALVAARPDHPLGPKLARGLLGHRLNGAWRSTQENVWSLLALDDYRRAAEAKAPDFDARVFLGAERVGDVSFRGSSMLDQSVFVDAEHAIGRARTPLTFEVGGKGRLFYSAELRYASAVLPARADDQGFFVQKRMRALRPAELAEAVRVLPKRSDPSAGAGDLVLVDVLLESAEPREQVVIDDPLPAGLEPIDFALDTNAASQNPDREALDAADSIPERLDYGAFRRPLGFHREQHDDKILTFVQHVDPGIYRFQYLARATTPGDFVVPPTRAECMYAPEVRGRTAASRFAVAVAAAPRVAPRARP